MPAPRRDRTESPRNVAAQPGPMQYRVLVDRADQSSWQDKRTRPLQCVLPRESPLLPAYQGSRGHPTIRDERGSLVRVHVGKARGSLHLLLPPGAGESVSTPPLSGGQVSATRCQEEPPCLCHRVVLPC